MIKSLTLEEKWVRFSLENEKTGRLFGGTGTGATPPPVSEPPLGGEEEENNTSALAVSILVNI
ncbi:hypothetical protein AB9P05_16835 [Roseivirga sp. BDSF3-8]|uniref:hypothetical protein n=1 Tax=Roseivirga sp. BDSF3-8 TaxID=3241598 RepID=UPI003531BE72